MTVESLKDCNKKHLAQLAKDQGIAGWHAMRKDQLIRALSVAPAAAEEGRRRPPAKAAGGRGRRPRRRRAGRRRPPHAPPSKPLPVMPPRALDHACVKDRIIAMVRDPYWLHVYWELSRSTYARAQAALGQEWHTARPILRLMDVTSEDTTSATERHVRDIEIHGGVNNWYIDVAAPPAVVPDRHRLPRPPRQVLRPGPVQRRLAPPRRASPTCSTRTGRASRSSSRRSTASRAGRASTAVSTDLRELFEERLRRPMHSLSLQSLGTGALPSLGRDFHFEIDAELIVYGCTEPNAQVTLQGEPVQLRPDGTFTVRFSLPDSRQIIPAVAASPDGVEERTIVLAVERNTKELEPMIHDGNEL